MFVVGMLFLLTISTTTEAEAAEIQHSTPPPTVSWTVYHSWDSDQNFQRRGVLTWTEPNAESSSTASLGDGSATATIDDPTSSSTTSRRTKDDATMNAGFRFVNDEGVTITQKEVKEMLSYGWYHVKIQGGGDNSDYTMATIPACNLRRSNFKDQFEVTIPRTTSMPTENRAVKDDRITSFAYSALVSPLAPKTCDQFVEEDSDDKRFSFSSKLSVSLDTPAMSIRPVLQGQLKPPPGLKFINNKKNKNQGSSKSTTADGGSTSPAADEDDDEDDTQSEQPAGLMGFLQRYWYILLPMLIMNFMTAPAEDQPPPAGSAVGQQQQQGGNGSAMAAQQTAAPTGGGSGGGNKRRGKRNS